MPYLIEPPAKFSRYLTLMKEKVTEIRPDLRKFNYVLEGSNEKGYRIIPVLQPAVWEDLEEQRWIDGTKFRCKREIKFVEGDEEAVMIAFITVMFPMRLYRETAIAHQHRTGLKQTETVDMVEFVAFEENQIAKKIMDFLACATNPRLGRN